MESATPKIRDLGMRLRMAIPAWMLAGTALCASAEPLLNVSGVAWTQYQEGITGLYQGAANFDHNAFYGSGGLLFLKRAPSDMWETNLSLGIAYGNSAIKRTIRNGSGLVISKTNPNSISLGMSAFLYEADVVFKQPSYFLKIGKFHYNYSDYNTNLGLYLLRGPVYPGFIYSGFDEIGGLTKSGVLASWSPTSSLRMDAIAGFETDFKPYMDLNLSGFVTYKAGMLELGAGVESQRLVESNSCVTSPKNGNDLDECLGGDPGSSYVGPGADLYKGAFFVIDTTARATTGKADTTTFSLAGTKVMLRGALDFKQFLSGYAGASRDWVMYFEWALLGVKDYPHLYEKKSQRMPVMAGMNLPTYGWLDLLSVELEYYASPFQNDPYKLVGAYDVFQFSDGNSINYAMSPIPPSSQAGSGQLSKASKDFDPAKDNWKWSVNMRKRLQENITVKAQVASDHWRVPNNNFVQYEVLANPGQYYGSLKLEYSL